LETRRAENSFGSLRGPLSGAEGLWFESTWAREENPSALAASFGVSAGPGTPWRLLALTAGRFEKG
jgi:hypothetical protein